MSNAGVVAWRNQRKLLRDTTSAARDALRTTRDEAAELAQANWHSERQLYHRPKLFAKVRAALQFVSSPTAGLAVSKLNEEARKKRKVEVAQKSDSDKRRKEKAQSRKRLKAGLSLMVQQDRLGELVKEFLESTHGVRDPKLEMVVECPRYDGATVKNIRATDKVECVDITPFYRSAGDAIVPASSSRLGSFAVSNGNTELSLLQTRNVYGHLVSFSKADGQRDFLYLLSHGPTQLQRLGDQGASTMSRALEEGSSVALGHTAAPCLIRAPCTDDCATNPAAERRFLHRRNRRKNQMVKWRRCYQQCRVHAVSNTTGRSLRYTEDTVSMMVNSAVGTALSQDLSLLRSCLEHCVEQSSVLIVGTPPRSCRIYANAVLRWFLPGKANRSFRATLLSILPRGRWWIPGVVEIWLPQALGEGVDEIAFIKEFSRTIARVLIWKQFATFPRHRWKGAKEATADIAIVEAFHGMYRPAMLEYARRKGIPIPASAFSGMREWMLRLQGGAPHAALEDIGDREAAVANLQDDRPTDADEPRKRIGGAVKKSCTSFGGKSHKLSPGEHGHCAEHTHCL